MNRQIRPANQNILIVLMIALAVVIVLLRMLVFATGHGRHHF